MSFLRQIKWWMCAFVSVRFFPFVSFLYNPNSITELYFVLALRPFFLSFFLCLLYPKKSLRILVDIVPRIYRVFFCSLWNYLGLLNMDCLHCAESVKMLKCFRQKKIKKEIEKEKNQIMNLQTDGCLKKFSTKILFENICCAKK